MAKAKDRQDGQQGFTLLETTIALVIMMVVTLGVTSLFLYAASNNLAAADRQMAMAVGQKRIEWLRSIPLNETTRSQAYSYPNGGLGQTSSGGILETVTSGGRNYEVRTIITDRDTDLDNTAVSNAIPPTIKIIEVRVRPLTSGPFQVTSVFASVTLLTQRTLIQTGPHTN